MPGGRASIAPAHRIVQDRGFNAAASIVSPRLRRPLLLVVLLLVAASAYGIWRVARLAPIGSAYAAKTLCSGVFLAGRQPEAVISEDILADNTWLLRLVQPHVDQENLRAWATFLGFARRDAQFRPGLGCTLAIGAPLPAESHRSRDDRGPDGPPLPVSAPSASVDAAALNAALAWAFDEPDRERLRRTRAVVVVHRGQVVAERYAPGFTADTPLPGWSMTKTAAAALTGILVGDGRLALASDALLSEWRGANDPRARITLAQLLRMTDGLAFDEQYSNPLSDVVVMLLGTGDASGFALGKPLAAVPGTTWRYSSGTTNVIAAVLRRRLEDADLSGLIRRRLFDRLGMHHAVVEPDAAGTPVLSSFMHATAREWAAFGQFLLQDGVWHGERLLPPGWLDYMRTATPQCSRLDFGAHLWLKVPQGFGGTQAAAAALPADAFHLSGHEAQVISVLPSRNLVVVRLGLSRLPRTWDHAEFLARVLKAFPPH
jgi:CubicO group peptidase (beta-lactamase class C family)